MKRVRKFSRKRLYMLTAAILAGLSALPSHALADSTEVPVETVYHNGEKFAEISFFPADVGLGKGNYWFIKPSIYTLSEKLQKATVSGVTYWTDMIGDRAKNKDTWTIYVNTENQQNATAGSFSMRSTGSAQSYVHYEEFVKNQLQHGKKLSEIDQDYIDEHGTMLPAGDYGFSEINIGKCMGANRTIGDGAAEYGWWVDADTVLPTNEQAADFVGTFRHELGHALGINALTETKVIYGERYYMMHRWMTSKDTWQLHLMDQAGKMAKPGMVISTSTNLPEGYSEKDVFLLDASVSSDGKGYAYFVGDNVRDALGGATFFGRSALPVKAWGSTSGFDGCHLQTTGMMSHRVYSNYTAFLEVELAVMQDLGYKIDRRAYFGRSVYGNGWTINNTDGYFARNSDGTAYLNNTYSTVPLGVGLHIYGSNNTVTQSANILTRGSGATGVRVDGMGNTLIIPEKTEIHADGYRGNGILIAYGSGQTVNQAGTVTASGRGGTGIRFDFGSSTNGAGDEYRGSYIRYKREVKSGTGEISEVKNLDITGMHVTEYNAAKNELDGAMVENYNLSGALVGGENAIYIAKNAFVKNININEGASIKGNITSDWKHFGEEASEGSYLGLGIQYGEDKRGEKGYAYSNYIPDLVTNLNFNADMIYTGNITGKDNMKMFVNGGTLFYGGTADVVSVEVAKDANLIGGSYKVNDMSDKMPPGFVDEGTGKFINHGMIMASDDGDMEIAGDLYSDGFIGLETYDDGEKNYRIDVSGKAEVGGTKLATFEGEIYLLKHEYTFLSADSVTGEMDTKAGDYFSAFLNIGSIDGMTVTLSLANNLGPLDENQTAVFNSLDDIYDVEDKEGRGRLGTLFSLKAEHGRAALTDLSTGPATDASLVMRQNTVMNALTARCRYLTHQANVPVTVPMENLVSHYAATAPKPSASAVDPGLDMIVPVELSEGGGLWFKFSKGWGSYGDGDVTGNGFASTVGADFSVSPQWKLGALFSYNNESYGGERDHRDTKDSRFGVYGDWRVGPQSAFLYIGGGWQKHDHSRHFFAGEHYNADADYNSRTIEFDGRYTYDLSYGKNGWHHKPFVSFQAVHYRQGSYTENGAYEFGQSVDSASNTYTAAAAGWDFARDFGKDGYVEFELGVSQVLGGDSMDCKANLMGIGQKFTLRSASMDKTRFLAGIYGSQALSDRWRIGGEIGLAQGAHDRDVSASISLRYSW